MSLQQLETTFVSNDKCAALWTGAAPLSQFVNCDAAPGREGGSCGGDQGGPVVNEAGELVGVMGFYNYCEEHSGGGPDVNGDPLSVLGWIEQNTI